MIRPLSVLLTCVLLAISAAPALAGPPVATIVPADSIFDGLNWLLNFLNQIQTRINDLFGWMQLLVNPTDALREQLAPILDRVYAVQSLATRIQALIASFPTQVQWTFGDLVRRLLALRPAAPGSAEGTIAKMTAAQPAGDVAQRAQVLDRVLEAQIKSLARARAAEATAQDISKQTAEDTAPTDLAQAQTDAAEEIFKRAQTTPSTRAAMQLLIEAFAAQMDQTARWNMFALGRQSAVVQSQALLAQQLSEVVDRLATSIDLQLSQQKEQLLVQANAAYASVTATGNTYGDMLIVAHEANSDQVTQRRQQLFDVLRRK